MDQEKESIFKRENKRTSVVLKKCECRRKPAFDCNDRRCNIDRQHAPEQVCGTKSAAYINELPKRKRTKDLVLHLDELWDLKLHRSIIARRYGATSSVCCKACGSL